MAKSAKTGKSASAKAADVIKAEITIKHKLTQDELHEKGREMIRKSREIALKKETRKAVAATAASEIKSMEAEHSDLQNQFDDGFENRTVAATVEFNVKKGVKSYFYHCPENKALHKTHIKDEGMEKQDYELDLPGMPAKPTAQPPPEATELAAAALQDKMQANQLDPEDQPRVHSAEEEGQEV